MKRVFLTLVFVLSLGFTGILAKSVDPVEAAKLKISEAVKRALCNCDLSIDKEILTRVSFVLNDKGEIVILKMNCNNDEALKSYLRKKLEFKKADIGSTSNEYKIYTLPIRFQAKPQK
ncbi:MAG: hypothetical protein HRT66_01575 [Flavobacteriaceae bacterium]|nr:hypothetical protein [Flavobacteriaceae bacterium]